MISKKSFKSNTMMMTMMIILLFTLNSLFAAVLLDSRSNYDSNDRELLNPILPSLLGECQGSCGKKRGCAPNLQCTKENKGELQILGFSNQFGYCEPRRSDKRNNKIYYCIDPYKVWYGMKGCPSGIDVSSQGKSCKPSDWIKIGRNCMSQPIPSSNCCKTAIEEYNSTHSICSEYRECPVYDTCSCIDIGTTKPNYVISCTNNSKTECGGHQCV